MSYADPNLFRPEPWMGHNYTSPPPTPPPPGTPTPPLPPPLDPTQQSAWAILSQTLANYGFTGQDLNDMQNFIKGELINGTGPDQITLDLEASPQFARRFPAIVYRREHNLPPVSPAEYLSLQHSYQQLEHSAGLTPQMFDNQHWDSLIANDVSTAEYATRINQGFVASMQAPPDVRQALQDFYNVSPGDLASFFLDPTKALPLLQQRFAAAQIGGASARTGFGEVSSSQAEHLAQLGISSTQAQTGFQDLYHQRQITGTLPGQQQTAIPTNDLLNAEFGGDTVTQELLARRAQEQKDYFAQQGQFTESGTGVTGLGQVVR